MLGKYILDGHTAVPVDLMTWARWFETADAARIVAQTTLPQDVRVSTVFLGIDHRFCGDGPPLLFETMIFGGAEDGYVDRYATWEDAEFGHAMAITLALATGDTEPADQPPDVRGGQR